MKTKIKGIPFEEFEKEMLQRPGVRHEYEKMRPNFEIAGQILEARLRMKMSQKELAEKVGTDQAVISRLEGINGSPSLSLLKRVAEALQTKITITVQ